MVAHVADLQETMRGQYRQHGNTANDKEILPVKDATDEGEAEEKRQHKLEIFAFLGIRLPEVQEKPQMRNGKNQQSKAFVAQNFQGCFAVFFVQEQATAAERDQPRSQKHCQKRQRHVLT